MHAMAQLVRAVVKAGQKVTVVSPVDDATMDVSIIDEGLAPVRVVRFVMPGSGGTFLGYRDEVIQLDMRFDDYYALQARRALPLVRNIVDDDRPDLIVLGHEAMLWGMLDTIGTWGIPTVLTSHGPLSAIANGQFKDHLVEPLLDLARQVDLVLAVSTYTARFIEKLGLKALPVRPIVDVDRFRPAEDADRLRVELGFDSRDIIVAHASNLRAVKRPLDIIESAAAVMREEPRISYLIMGEGPLRETLQQRCREHGIAERVRFTGWVPHTEIDGYMRVADIFVLSSVSEGMPYGALEPMACGRALIASDLAWTQEVLAEGQSMLSYQRGDVDALARRTLRLARDEALRTKLGHAGREYVLRHHQEGRVVEAFMDAVAPLLATAEGSKPACARRLHRTGRWGRSWPAAARR